MEDSHPSSHRIRAFFKKALERLSAGVWLRDGDAQVDEIKQMVSEGQEMGVLEDEEAKMISNIWNLAIRRYRIS